MKFKKLILLGIIAFFLSCKPANHFHDGEYETSLLIAEVKIRIDGNTVYVENSLTGNSKFNCEQFEDRIEYSENNGTTTIIKVLENGNLEINGIYEAKKIK